MGIPMKLASIIFVLKFIWTTDTLQGCEPSHSHEKAKPPRDCDMAWIHVTPISREMAPHLWEMKLEGSIVFFVATLEVKQLDFQKWAATKTHLLPPFQGWIAELQCLYEFGLHDGGGNLLKAGSGNCV